MQKEWFGTHLMIKDRVLADVAYSNLPYIPCPHCNSALERLPLRMEHKLSLYHHSDINPKDCLKRYACIGCGDEFILHKDMFFSYALSELEE